MMTGKTSKKLAGLPPPRVENQQPQLFETRELNHGSCRHFTGDFFELATVALVGGKRLRTCSQYATCPDIQWQDKICFECKSVGLTRAAIVYEVRIKRDRKFVRRGYELYYWFWHHKHKVGNEKLIPELNRGLAQNVREVVVVNFTDLDRWLTGRPVKVMNTGQLSRRGKKVGWGSAGYGMGWGVPVSAVKEMAPEEWIVRGLKVSGEAFNRFLLHGSNNMKFLPWLFKMLPA